MKTVWALCLTARVGYGSKEDVSVAAVAAPRWYPSADPGGNGEKRHRPSGTRLSKVEGCLPRRHNLGREVCSTMDPMWVRHNKSYA